MRDCESPTKYMSPTHHTSQSMSFPSQNGLPKNSMKPHCRERGSHPVDALPQRTWWKDREQQTFTKISFTHSLIDWGWWYLMYGATFKWARSGVSLWTVHGNACLIHVLQGCVHEATTTIIHMTTEINHRGGRHTPLIALSVNGLYHTNVLNKTIGHYANIIQ